MTDKRGGIKPDDDQINKVIMARCPYYNCKLADDKPCDHYECHIVENWNGDSILAVAYADSNEWPVWVYGDTAVVFVPSDNKPKD